MASFNLGQVLNTIKNATLAVKAAREVVDQLRETGALIDGVTADDIDAELARMNAEYEVLHKRVQQKLRGS